MKQKPKLFIAILCGILLLSLLVWRLWPRSLESISGLDFDQAVSVSAHTQTTEFEAGTPTFVYHKIGSENTEHFDPLLALFREVEARPSLTNLLRPWPISGFSWTGPVDFLSSVMVCGNDGCTFTFTDRGELTVGNYLYFITDEEQFTALWEYITTHGTENKS